MKEKVVNYIKQNLSHLERDTTTGGYSHLPKFQLTPRDFVAFAEKDLDAESIGPYQLVNATSNLKRAVDCQLDLLLSFLGLDGLYRQKHLGVDRKLGFFKEAGVFNARSLEKLNKFRNRLEHHYEVPNVQDVDAYFDVVSAFVTIGENLVSNLMSAYEVHLDNLLNTGLISKINFETPSIAIYLGDDVLEVNLDKSAKPKIEDIQLFAFLLRIHILLIHFFNGAITPEALISDLEKAI
ncbi:hypothetical protein J2R62_17120 [Plesiomonas shigelloides]|uniref:Uncharacterized protein n=1 Tax=Plesiomonas shigelloides TaxID=703 RepID=A0A8I1W9Q9_PLESH|nr:hypothetical protein [Plesiomonas shigelloides]MBO1109891.1 hypothetical protein [Plesiomonas shigelloides]